MSKKHAVVTGGGRGIGAAIAKALGKADMAVTVMGRNMQVLEETAKALPCAQAIQIDVTDRVSVENAFKQATADAPVDILINNAGAVDTAPFDKTSEELWQRMLEVNLTGAFRCTQQVIESMRANGFGRIVNLASTASLKGYPYVTAYCAAKHGLLGLTRSLALETIRDGITVNAVCPGYTETDLLTGSIERIVQSTGRSAEEARAMLLKSNPQKRFIQPEEVAASVLWLCSSEAASVTGQAISISGGEVM